MYTIFGKLGLVDGKKDDARGSVMRLRYINYCLVDSFFFVLRGIWVIGLYTISADHFECGEKFKAVAKVLLVLKAKKSNTKKN
jgi:hypothetical protein